MNQLKGFFTYLKTCFNQWVVEITNKTTEMVNQLEIKQMLITLWDLFHKRWSQLKQVLKDLSFQEEEVKLIKTTCKT